MNDLLIYEKFILFCIFNKSYKAKRTLINFLTVFRKTIDFFEKNNV